jgi:hypothetical protein
MLFEETIGCHIFFGGGIKHGACTGMSYLSCAEVKFVRKGLILLFLCAVFFELGVCGWSVYVAAAGGSDEAAILAACLLVSYTFRCLFLVKIVKEKALELLQQPSSLRAVSLALTCPFQIYLVARVIGLKCTVGLTMLVVAQFVASALCLVLEVTLVSAEVEECQPSGAAAPELMVGTNITGPAADLDLLSTHRMRTGWAWFATLVCSGALHIAIWTVLMFHFVSMKAAESTTNVQLLVVGQFVALTLI